MSGSVGQAIEDGMSCLDVHAGVGDTLPVGERRQVARILPSRNQEALQHQADEASFAGGGLVCHRGRHRRLAVVVLAAVAVAGVHHQAGRQPGRPQEVQRLGDVLGEPSSS